MGNKNRYINLPPCDIGDVCKIVELYSNDIICEGVCIGFIFHSKRDASIICASEKFGQKWKPAACIVNKKGESLYPRNVYFSGVFILYDWRTIYGHNRRLIIDKTKNLHYEI